MPYAGKVIMPREFAAACAKHWGGVGLVKAVATGIGESHLYLGAWHDNLNMDHGISSRDNGVFQINLPVHDGQPGTEEPASADEAKVRTPSTDPAVYVPVLAASVEAAFALYTQPWTRNGEKGIREWQPWYAYTQGWATFPEWWVWHLTPDPPHWFETGRYIQKAIVGVANYHLILAKDWSGEEAVAYARKMAQVFKVRGVLALDREKGVRWASFPAKPTEPPADGIGPRPHPNDGR